MNDNESDCCPRCGADWKSEDCYQCHGCGGRDLTDDNPIEYEPSEWEDCNVCDGTGVVTWCPNVDCPGQEPPVSDSGVPTDNRIATSVATRNVTETTPQQPPIVREWFPIVDRQPDPGARARRKARKAQRQNRQRGRRQHAH